MTTANKYLQLLRTACFGMNADVDWDSTELQEILRLSQIHGTGPLIYNELLKTPLEPEMKLQMKQVCMHNMLLQGEWERIIEKVWQCLSKDGIYAVLMKGFAYAHWYPLPYLRMWGDLDVWVGPEQYHRACGLLREAFPEAKHHDEEWDELKHYCFVFPDGKSIELHRVSMDFLNSKDQAYWCQLEEDAVLQLRERPEACSLEVGSVRVPVFEPKFDLLFCFMHSWEHFCGTGIPLKQVCDIVLLMRKLHMGSDPACSFTETEAYLDKHLRALGMLEVWRSYGYMVCRAMDMPFEDWPLGVDDTYGERLYKQVLMEGQCRPKDYGEASDRYEARENARRMNVFARKLLTLRGRIDKARFMYRFAPRYARYVLWQEIRKGIRRTIKREEMINY